jgi:hypothetical protein
MPKSLFALLFACALLLMAAWLESCSDSEPTIPGGTAGELGGSLAAGTGQYAHKFNTAGSFNYHCAIHPSCALLSGRVVVVAAAGTIQNRVLAITQSGGTSGPYGGSCSALSLQLDSVYVGDTVTWSNISPFAHTVTSQ